MTISQQNLIELSRHSGGAHPTTLRQHLGSRNMCGMGFSGNVGFHYWLERGRKKIKLRTDYSKGIPAVM